MSESPRVHREPFRVRAYEVGPHGLVSVVTVCDYLQETAGVHARSLGFDRVPLQPGSPATGIWVLRRLRLHADRLPASHETVTVETWPSYNDGLRAYREYLIFDAGDSLIAKASSAWFVIDPDRRRPVRLGHRLDGLELPARPRPFEQAFDEPIQPVDRVETRVPFPVRYTDLDQNGHANHARFVEWAMESVPASYIEAHTCMGFDVVIENEVRPPDRVVAVASLMETGWRHTIYRDDSIVARLTSTWSHKGGPEP